jgi:hypothetical protein
LRSLLSARTDLRATAKRSVDELDKPVNQGRRRPDCRIVVINPGNLIPLGSAGVGDRAALLERDDGVCAAGAYQNGYTFETSRLDPGKRWI